MEITPIFGSQFCEMIIPLIDASELEIRIIIFNWRMPFITNKLMIQSFNDAIVRAVQRGVKVRCIVSNHAVASELGRFGINAKVLETAKRLHTKLMIIDHITIVVGSHNYSESAFNANHEVSVLFNCWENLNKFVEYFENMWSN